MNKRLTGGEGWSFEPAGESVKTPAPEKKSSPKFSMSVEYRSGAKTVTLLKGIQYLGRQRLEKLAASLKMACGTGGTLKAGIIELQGDQRSFVKDWLKKNPTAF